MANAVPPQRIDLWRPVVAFVTLFMLGAVLAVAVGAVSGCAVGYPVRADGTADLSNPSIGVGVGSVNHAAAGGLGAIGVLTGNPLVLGLGALVANQLGKRRGWDEKLEDDLKSRGIVATKE